MAAKRRNIDKVLMIAEDESRDSHTFSFVHPKTASQLRESKKLRMRKYHPVRRQHVWFIEVRMPPHSK